ncbi:MAG: hypothetical protein MRY21_08500 [Simkaniaceae bacterium]|nr:hypothetical protein [Simkaniaceae bacterium]
MSVNMSERLFPKYETAVDMGLSAPKRFEAKPGQVFHGGSFGSTATSGTYESAGTVPTSISLTSKFDLGEKDSLETKSKKATISQVATKGFSNAMEPKLFAIETEEKTANTLGNQIALKSAYTTYPLSSRVVDVLKYVSAALGSALVAIVELPFRIAYLVVAKGIFKGAAVLATRALASEVSSAVEKKFEKATGSNLGKLLGKLIDKLKAEETKPQLIDGLEALQAMAADASGEEIDAAFAKAKEFIESNGLDRLGIPEASQVKEMVQSSIKGAISYGKKDLKFITDTFRAFTFPTLRKRSVNMPKMTSVAAEIQGAKLRDFPEVTVAPRKAKSAASTPIIGTPTAAHSV